MTTIMPATTLTPIANDSVAWRGWEIEHSDDGIFVNREFDRGCFLDENSLRSDTFSASLTCAMHEGELWCYITCETHPLSQTLMNQLNTIYETYATAGLYDDLLENRE